MNRTCLPKGNLTKRFGEKPPQRADKRSLGNINRCAMSTAVPRPAPRQLGLLKFAVQRLLGSDPIGEMRRNLKRALKKRKAFLLQGSALILALSSALPLRASPEASLAKRCAIALQERPQNGTLASLQSNRTEPTLDDRGAPGTVPVGRRQERMMSPLDWLKENETEWGKFSGSTIPNEKKTDKLLPFFNEKQPGFYLSVGTERGLIGASLAKADGLLWIDRDPTIIAYNYFIRALMYLSHDRIDYLKLRHSTHPQEILERAMAMMRDNPDSSEALSPLLFRGFPHWLETMIRTHPGWRGFDREWSQTTDFLNTNYLRDDALFSHIHSLARRGRLVILHANLSETTLIVETMNSIRHRFKAHLGVVDFSNAWEEGYLGSVKTQALLLALTQWQIGELNRVCSELGINFPLIA